MSSLENLSSAQRVTQSILAMLERGVRPWIRPWNPQMMGGPSFPLRATGQPYKGINVVTLWAAADEKGYSLPHWLTFKQALALGGAVRKGERGHFVVFYRELPKLDADDPAEPRKRVLRGFTVFNQVQVDGLDAAFPTPPFPRPFDAHEHAARFARVPAQIRHGGTNAFFAMSTDHIQLPLQEAFRDATHYYATLAHELGHWTRHPNRLNRDFGQKRYGDAGYALEELVAELTAAFIGATIGLPSDHIENHASYIADWLKVLKDNPSAFLTAAGKAQAAADYLLLQMGEKVEPAASDD